MGPRESTQLHDVNPGDLNVPGEPNHFPDGGLFWTRRVPENSIEVDLDDGNAAFVFSNFSMLDSFTAGNAIFRPPGFSPVPATASVDIQWTGTGERVKVDNVAEGFAGQYEKSDAALLWSIANDNSYAFSTANSSETNVPHALVSHVRNGSFHRGKK